MSPGYVHRGLSTHDIPRLRKRDHRAVEVFVDCYGDSEVASAIEVYLSDALDYPFPAIWRRPDGSRERITVVALSGNWDDDTGLIFEVDSDEGDDFAPAHQVHGLRPGRIQTVLDDYRAWWPYDTLALDDDMDDDE
jgi:hypothetical protein